MEIVGGYDGGISQRRTGNLIKKIGDLPPYQSVVVMDGMDSLNLSRGYQLSKDAIFYMFINSFYEDIPKCFEQLSNKQKSDFLNYLFRRQRTAPGK